MMNTLFALMVLFGQTAIPPAFEVASIKEVPPVSIENIRAGRFHVGININGSLADYGFMSLANLISYAYGVKRYQLSGPGWMDEARWDILARIPEGQPSARAPEMMQKLLADRFKLAIHRENREQPVYSLVAGKGGPRIKEAPAGEEVGGGMSINDDGRGLAISGGATGRVRLTQGANGGLQMQMAKITMAALADMLTQFVDRPVVDATELKGNYQVTLDLPIEAMTGMSFAAKVAAFAGLGSFGARGGGFPDASVPGTSGLAIMEAVKHIGLELQSRKAPVETIIVDRVDKTPTAN